MAKRSLAEWCEIIQAINTKPPGAWVLPPLAPGQLETTPAIGEHAYDYENDVYWMFTQSGWRSHKAPARERE